MSGRLTLTAAVAAVVLAATPAVAQSQPAQTITATGTGDARVLPKNRHSNSSIAAAVDAARKASIGGALSQAHEYALEYAAAAGLTLGGVVSVSDASANGYGSGPGAFIGPFGPNHYCGTVRQLIGRPHKGRKPKFKKVHRCYVPRFAFITLTVSYSAG